MSAKESQEFGQQHEPSSTHTWPRREGRLLEIEADRPLIHRRCSACGRSFIHDLAMREWYAVIPRIFDFERLYEVSERWLIEACTGAYQPSDEEARRLVH
jgi:hypothetical protein